MKNDAKNKSSTEETAEADGPTAGDPKSVEAWTPEIYEQLRRMAESTLHHERSGHTLNPTALAHEVWLRLLKSRNANELDHGAFLGVAAQAMRRILTEHARRRAADKRGGSGQQTTLSGISIPTDVQEFALDLENARPCTGPNNSRRRR